MAVSAIQRRARVRRRRHTSSGRRHRLTVYALRLLGVVGGILLWETAAKAGWVNVFFTSSPSRVADQLWALVESGDAFRHTKVTVMEAGLGLGIGAVGGVLTGFLLSRWQIVEEVFEPFITVTNSIPRLALTPLFIVWFGIGLTSKVVLIITLVFFVLLINTLAAVKSVDPDLVIVARLLGASKRRVLLNVVLPSSVPWIFAGLRLGLAYSLTGAVVGEMIAAQAGLGFLVSYNAGTLNITGVMVAVVILLIVAYAAEVMLSQSERWLLRWRPTGLSVRV